VPQTATYKFTLAGAAGGHATQYTSAAGAGAVLSASVRLAQSNLVYLIVGQLGLNAAYGGAGGDLVPRAALFLHGHSPKDAEWKPLCRQPAPDVRTCLCQPLTGGGSYVFTDNAAFSVNTPVLVAGEPSP
jgi:hypothetical protein